MSEIEVAIVVLCGVFGWVALLHHRIAMLQDEQGLQRLDIMSLQNQVKRLLKELGR